jgi:endonuclease-8
VVVGGFLRRLRDDDPTRRIGDALLEQRTVAGLGTIWRSEGCFLAGLDPWRPAGAVGDEEALAVVRAVRAPMQVSARDGFSARLLAVYGRTGQPCPRCGTAVARRNQWDDNRPTYWCPGCQS